MVRFLLPFLVLVVLAGAPLSVSAADACVPACGTGQTCLQGKCIVTPTGDGGLTKPRPDGDGGLTKPTPGGDDAGLTNPLKNIESLPQLLQVVLKAIVDIGTIILTLALVYVGFLFVVAQGNAEKIQNAKSALLWTIIGGLILLGASAIGAVIGATVKAL